MFDLQRYQHDITQNKMRMGIFCDDLMDSFESQTEAETWFINELMPCWDCVLEEHFGEE